MHAGFCPGAQRGRALAMMRSAAGHKSRQEALRGFLRVTSHDLRTPCHGIAVACALLRARPGVEDDPDATALADACAAGCGLTLAVVNNVLAAADVDAGGSGEASRAAASRAAPPPSAAAPRPRAALAAAMRTCRLGCGAAPSALRWRDGEASEEEDDASDGVVAAVDPERFSQIALNLLVFALQDRAADAPPLEVSLRVDGGGGDASAGQLEVTVRHVMVADADIVSEGGVAEERLFSATGSCAGLGLHVARFFARAAGGDVAAAPEACSPCISLRATLPTRRAAAPGPPPPPSPTPSPHHPKRQRPPQPLPPAQPAAPASEPLSVLVVEDHELNRRLVCRLLERHGFAVRAAAAHGAEALHELTAPGALPPPALVLTDMQMPHMSGAELARALRAWEADRAAAGSPPRPRLYIAALTAGVLECEAGSWAEHGFDACLAKPLRTEALAALRTAVEARLRGDDD